VRTLVGTLPPEPDPGPGRRPRHRIGVVQFLREVVNECRKINPPLRSEVVTYSAVSLLWVAGVTALIVGLDVVLAKGVLRALGL
jgi:preprotein translocase subunit SecE